MDKIIFLDFDGVLNSIGTKDRVDHPLFPGHRVRGVDNFRVKLVSDLALETGAKIVISSTWREMYTLEWLREFLYSRGMDRRVEIIDFTPKSYETIGWGLQPRRGERGDDIQLWLEQNGNPPCYLVLDDLETNHPGHQVLTQDSTGFFQGLMKRARFILNRSDDAGDQG
jgi:hypothetical protein